MKFFGTVQHDFIDKNILDVYEEGLFRKIWDYESFHRIPNTDRFWISSYGRVLEYKDGNYTLIANAKYYQYPSIINGVFIPISKARTLRADNRRCGTATEVQIQYIDEIVYTTVKIASLMKMIFLIPIEGKRKVCFLDGNNRNFYYKNMVLVDMDEYVRFLSRTMSKEELDRIKKRQKYQSMSNYNRFKKEQLYRDMIRRCYDPKYLDANPEYKDVTVCQKWIDYPELFYKWVDENIYYYDGPLELDKDVMAFNGKREYNPETARLVPKYLNQSFTSFSRKNAGNLPPIVHKILLKSGEVRFRGSIYEYKKSKQSAKLFRTVDEAELYTINGKIDYLEYHLQIEIEKKFMPDKVLDAMKQWINILKNKAEILHIRIEENKQIDE